MPSTRKRARQAGSSGSSSTPKVSSAVDEDAANDKGDDDADEYGKEYEIEAFLDHRYDEQGGVEYLVAWTGYAAQWNLWVPRANCDGCEEMLSKYDEEWDVDVRGEPMRASKKTPKKEAKEPAVVRRSRASSAQASVRKQVRKPPPSASSKAVRPMRTSTRLKDKQKASRPIEEMTNDDVNEIVDEETRLKVKCQIGRERFGVMLSWEDVVTRINGMSKKGDITAVELDFEGGFHFAFPLDHVRERCPQRLIEYFVAQSVAGEAASAPEKGATVPSSRLPIEEDQGRADR